MSLQTIKYFCKDGFKNIFLNKTMAAASISIVVAALTVVGIFIEIGINLEYISQQIEKTVDMIVFLKKGQEEKAVVIEEYLRKNVDVREYKYISPHMALQDLKNKLGKNAFLLEGLEKDNPLRGYFVVKPVKIEYTKKLAEELETLDGVAQVYFPSETVDKLRRILKIINLFSILLIIGIYIVAIFIIANTVKITLFARRREISIMRYIGATNRFISGPFVVEGFIIGILGSILAYAIVLLFYHYTISYLSQTITFIDFVNISIYKYKILGVFILTGAW
ncbi:permease-like cell division protein FtsX [Anaerocellum danielii]|uniref:permease-like cell division protein FtsX n=1 Tax=Anaerocellum danielii TaxID=1387557 RepID=UPI000A7C9592|nr:permease-like cell division protein FtsX [Caldicellulosiruptor danielii]